MADAKKVETTGLLGWFDARFPLTSTIKGHLTEYYAPKNFNFWYFFWFISVAGAGAADCDWYFPDHELQARR